MRELKFKFNKNIIPFIKEWINNNPATAIGIVIGLILGILLFTLGIFKTLLLLIFMGIGYWLGRNKDKDGSLIDQVIKKFKQ
ncbi:MAG: DUF2273 domain-containing protein [Spirochaetota bacterium]